MEFDTAVAPVLEGVTGGLSPPDSNPALKDTGSDSDLSDLDPDPADHDMIFDEPITQHTASASATERKTPELWHIEPTKITDGVPIFEPTMEQMQDFTQFVDSINHYGMQSGIVKVIPPQEWKDQMPPIDDAIKTINIKDPMSQEFQKGETAGEYRQINMDHRKSYNLPLWRAHCDSRPAPMPRGKKAAGKENGRSDTNKRRQARAARKVKSEVESPARPITPQSPIESAKHEARAESVARPRGRMGGGRQLDPESEAVSVSARRKYGQRATGKIDEAAFVGFDYRFDCSEFTDERCEELEVAYWRSLMNAASLYGADMMGSLFDDRTKTWNLGKLPNLLDVLGETIPGVNTAYLYFGSWKSTFAWHLEDVDLYSINYLHFGAPKQWYSIAQEDVPKFEACMRKAFPDSAKSCDQFLRHKTFLISPARLLAASGVKVNKVVHRPGEFVITFPYGYHSGYNLGYNCAEAVNFALESWLEKGTQAKKCDCAEKQDPVWIDVRKIKKALGHDVEASEDEFTEDDFEYDDLPNDLPTPPAEIIGDIKVKQAPRKRKRVAGDKSDGGRIIRIKLSPKEQPCFLCPNAHPAELLLPAEGGNKKVHRLCAEYIPETKIIASAAGKTVVAGLQSIDKDRFTKLHCYHCKARVGACFQCANAKCTRAYHATCAAAAGVLVERGWAPVYAEDGTEYKKWHVELSCRFHRPKRDKGAYGPAAPPNKRDHIAEDFPEYETLVKAARGLQKNDTVQVQYLKGSIWAGVVLENRTDEEAVLLDVLPHGGFQQAVQYKWLLMPDPTKPRFQQASDNAQELPESFGDRSANSSNRQADDLPKAEDVFVEGHKWAEFKRQTILPNREQVKVDLAKKDQLWYYLGKTSTEARAQFTEDPSKSRHNKAGNFLDGVPKANAAVSRPSYPATYPHQLHGLSPLKHSMSAATPNSLQHPRPTVSSKQGREYEYKPRANISTYSAGFSNPLHGSAVLQYGSDPQFQIGSKQSTMVARSGWQQPPFHQNYSSQHVLNRQNPLTLSNPLQNIPNWVPPSHRADRQPMEHREDDSKALERFLSQKDAEYRVAADQQPLSIQAQFGLAGTGTAKPTIPSTSDDPHTTDTPFPRHTPGPISSEKGSHTKSKFSDIPMNTILGRSVSHGRSKSRSSVGSQLMNDRLGLTAHGRLDRPKDSDARCPTDLPVPSLNEATTSEPQLQASPFLASSAQDLSNRGKSHSQSRTPPQQSPNNTSQLSYGQSGHQFDDINNRYPQAAKLSGQAVQGYPQHGSGVADDYSGSNHKQSFESVIAHASGQAYDQGHHGHPERPYHKPDINDSKPPSLPYQPTPKPDFLQRTNVDASQFVESKGKTGDKNAIALKSNQRGAKYTYPVPTKSTNVGLTQSWKYKYLQLEHNKGSSDYKSPYRPGPEFGFMNGYQGSVLSGAILKELSKFLTLPQLEEAKRMTLSQAHKLLDSLPRGQTVPQQSKTEVYPAFGQKTSESFRSRPSVTPPQTSSFVLAPHPLTSDVCAVSRPAAHTPTSGIRRPDTSLSWNQLDAPQTSSPCVAQPIGAPHLLTPSDSLMPTQLHSQISAAASHFQSSSREQSQQYSLVQTLNQAQKSDTTNLQEFRESPVSNMQPCTSSLIEGILGKLKKVH